MKVTGSTRRESVRWTRPAAAERAEVVRALRRRVTDEGMNRTSGLRTLVRGVLLVAPPAVTGYLALRQETSWAWILHLLVATAALCTLPAVYHEATHSNVSRNRFLNDGVGTLAGALHGVPFATWRYFHLAHHANTGTENDSEVYPTIWSRWTLITFPLTQWAFMAILWRWTWATSCGGGPRWIRTDRQRRAVAANAAATAALWAIEVAACVLQPLLVPLLVAPCVISMMIAALTLVPEHFPAYRSGPGEPDQLDRTATFHSNPLVRLVLWNSNFHAAHHFAPKVPAHRLGQLDSMISAIQDPPWRWSGYYTWYRGRLRDLSWTPIDLAVAAGAVHTVGTADTASATATAEET